MAPQSYDPMTIISTFGIFNLNFKYFYLYFYIVYTLLAVMLFYALFCFIIFKE